MLRDVLVGHTRRVRIGVYELRGEIGRGAVGVVHRAVGPDGREVALKLLQSSDAESEARFDRERRILDELGPSSGFVPLLDAGDSPRGPFFVMPLLTGGTLKDRLARGPLAVEATRALGVAVASALARAHERGVVHRDLKPANLLFPDAEASIPLVADLGLARHTADTGTVAPLSRSGMLAGTLGYLAPEQADDMRKAGPPADVFALGAILYECLTAERPFGRDGLLQVLDRVAKGQFTPLRRLRPDAPAWLAAVIERCLAPDPAARPRDGGELARALARPPARPRRTLALAASVLALAVLAAGLGLAMRAPRDEKASAKRPERAPPPSPPPPRTPSRPEKTTSPELDAIIEKALALKDRDHDNAGARDEATKAIALAPGDVRGWVLRAAARANLGDADGAFDDATKATGVDASVPLPWLIRAVVLTTRGRMEEALASVERAIALDGKSPHEYVVRATIHRALEHHEEALADAERAIELDPRDGAGYTLRAWERLHYRKDAPGAIEDATTAIALHPEVSDNWATRGEALAHQGDLDRGLADLERALTIAPNNSRARIARGWTRFVRGDRAGAREDLELACRIDARARESDDARLLRARLDEQR